MVDLNPFVIIMEQKQNKFIFLGTNDLKHRFSLKAIDIAQGVESLVKIVKQSDTGYEMKPPEVLVIIPPSIEMIEKENSIMCGGKEKSLELLVIG